MSQSRPSVGRVVHYQAYGTPGGEYPSVPRAAIITEVFSDTEVQVCVLNPTGIFFNRVTFSDPPKPGYWNWPTYVPPMAPTNTAELAYDGKPEFSGTEASNIRVAHYSSKPPAQVVQVYGAKTSDHFVFSHFKVHGAIRVSCCVEAPNGDVQRIINIYAASDEHVVFNPENGAKLKVWSEEAELELESAYKIVPYDLFSELPTVVLWRIESGAPVEVDSKVWKNLTGR